MLIEFRQKFLKLFGALEDVRVVRVHIISVFCIAVDGRGSISYRAACILQSFVLEAALSLHQVHMLLQLLLVVKGNSVWSGLLFTMAPPMSRIEYSLRSLVHMRLAKGGGRRRQKAESG